MDLTTTRGFCHLLCLLLRMPVGAILWMAPVCSSFVWISASVTRRSRAFPCGRRGVLSVEVGNLLLTRTILAIMLASAKQICWVLEQPNSTKAKFMKRFQKLLRQMTVWRASVNLKPFGSPTPKPLLCNAEL